MQVLIIGNSAAGLNALESFRRLDSSARVTMVSAEAGPAYSRVLLPYFLRRRLPYERLFIRRAADYARLGAQCLFETRVEQVEPSRARVRLADGRLLAYDRLLLATGARPVSPPIPGLEGPGVFHLWTLADALDLEPLLEPGRRLLVLGSGFVALQAAWAAAARGLQVTVFELRGQIMPTALDPRSAAVLAERIRDHGVDLRTAVHTEAVERAADGSLRISIRGAGSPETFDLMIVGTGVRANTELLADALPEARQGVPVDARMQTGIPGIYAAGDVALGPTAYGETHASHALWPTAVEHGKIAGQEMAGHRTAYRGSLSMNVTQMFGVTVASMGRQQPEEEGAAGAGCAAQVWERFEPERPRYLRLLTRDGVPIGAGVIGESADAALLGQLRPFVRLGKALPDPERFLAEGANPGTALRVKPGWESLQPESRRREHRSYAPVSS
jgi:nitrite reductase (NADH) large subunit